MKNKKIFIVEDDVNILYGLESDFQADDFEVMTNEGEDELETIIEQIRDFEPDYIILDVILPKIDGFELVKRLKSDEELGEREIFIFTDLSDEDSKARSLELGADYFFFKNEFDDFEFAEKVKKIIANREKLSGSEEAEEVDAEDYSE